MADTDYHKLLNFVSSALPKSAFNIKQYPSGAKVITIKTTNLTAQDSEVDFCFKPTGAFATTVVTFGD